MMILTMTMIIIAIITMTGINADDESYDNN